MRSLIKVTFCTVARIFVGRANFCNTSCTAIVHYNRALCYICHSIKHIISLSIFKIDNISCRTHAESTIYRYMQAKIIKVENVRSW